MAACLSNPLGKIHCCIHCQINIAKQIIKLLLLGSNKQTNQQQLVGICLELWIITLLATYQDIH
jgi:hypothetical protein